MVTSPVAWMCRGGAELAGGDSRRPRSRAWTVWTRADAGNPYAAVPCHLVAGGAAGEGKGGGGQ